MEELVLLLKKKYNGFGVKMADYTHLINLYADDVTLSVEANTETQLIKRVETILRVFKKFQKRSGLELNRSKMFVLPIGAWDAKERQNIGGCPVRQKVSILGVDWGPERIMLITGK